MASSEENELNEREVAVLETLHADPLNAGYNSYTLVERLHPKVTSASKDERTKTYNEAGEITAKLIKLGSVRGDLKKDAIGAVYFADLRLTASGEQKLITHQMYSHQ